MNIKKFLIGASASAVMLGATALPAFALYGDQPGYDKASDCGQSHGSFGFFGNSGNVHDVHDTDRTTDGVQGYDEYSDGTDDNVGQGAEGGVTGGTGDRNSNACGNPQHDF